MTVPCLFPYEYKMTSNDDALLGSKHTKAGGSLQSMDSTMSFLDEDTVDARGHLNLKKKPKQTLG